MQEILNQLKELSYNLSWTWNNEFYSVFEEINKDIWTWSDRNPIKFLDTINHHYLLETIERKNLRDRITEVYIDYKNYVSADTFYKENYSDVVSPTIAYFSAEFGIANCLKLYSGGLGVLSGDHMKSSSDLGLPLVGVGLAYLYGYFRQYIDKNGRQSELYEKNNFEYLPMHLVTDDHYRPIKISVDMPGRKVKAQIWKLIVGRVNLFMLDTFVDENTVDDKRITDILYGGDTEKRIQQEILLGIGGKMLLDRLGYNIKAYHLNEGHSAFLCFERIADKMKELNIPFHEAKKICYNSNIFTTHTPVPAGIDIFERELIEKYFKTYAEERLKLSFDEFFKEGDLYDADTSNTKFNMAELAINNSNFINGVSKLHGDVSRKMWNLHNDRTQIDSITNGIHTKTFLSKYSERLYINNFGKDWIKHENIWDMISTLPDSELWNVRSKNRHRLVNFVRESLSDNLKSQAASYESIKDAEEILDDNALTIGFARRFATYKRGNLIFRDLERLKRILTNPKMPVQFIFSGKAHPKDNEGKAIIAEIVAFMNDNSLNHKIVFLENYELEVAKRLVQGCDVWLNNPRRPQEASGTSGMKVIANGGLNFSILDGWWAEAYAPEFGWKIDSIETDNLEEKDWFEANSMYDTLEKEIIPVFYLRDVNGLPVEWIKKMKASIKSLAGYFSTQRMVEEYTEKFYTKVF
jgi:starch phosphorylase